MKQQNICKFPLPSLQSTLSVSCFVQESHRETMEHPSLLKEAHRMLLVVGGKGYFCFDEQRMPFHCGSLFFGFSGERFFTEPEQDVVYLYIDFSGYRGEELLRRFGINRMARSFDGFDGLIPLWKESLARASEQTIDLATESILLYTFSRLSGNVTKQNDLIDSIVKMTEEQFADSNLSLSEIARILAYNPKYLSHLFKKKTGITYSEYLRTLRMKYAISLFNSGLDSIKNVAVLSGFADPLYFSNVFKKNIGVSPTEYIHNRSTEKEGG